MKSVKKEILSSATPLQKEQYRIDISKHNKILQQKDDMRTTNPDFLSYEIKIANIHFVCYPTNDLLMTASAYNEMIKDSKKETKEKKETSRMATVHPWGERDRC